MAVTTAAHLTTAVRAAISRERATGVSCPITRRLSRAQTLGTDGGPVGRGAHSITNMGR